MTGEYDKAEFEQHEDNIQKKFDDMKVSIINCRFWDSSKIKRIL